MPTGYTCGVKSGEVRDLKDYMLKCARGFGALVHMKDDGLSVVIKPKEVNSYYLRRLNEVQEKYKNFLEMSDEEIQKEIDENHNRVAKRKVEGLKNLIIEKQRYLEMLDKVQKWNPPTENHKKLKEFAVEQLTCSIDFDCSNAVESYYKESTDTSMTVDEYKNIELRSYLENVERCAKRYREELKSVEESNKWVEDLVKSL